MSYFIFSLARRSLIRLVLLPTLCWRPTPAVSPEAILDGFRKNPKKLKRTLNRYQNPNQSVTLRDKDDQSLPVLPVCVSELLRLRLFNIMGVGGQKTRLRHLPLRDTSVNCLRRSLTTLPPPLMALSVNADGMLALKPGFLFLRQFLLLQHHQHLSRIQ